MRIPRRAFVIAVLLMCFSGPLAAGGLQTSPSEILRRPDEFDGRLVTLAGQVMNLKEHLSEAGKPYYRFDLTDGTRAIRVFGFGVSPCRGGAYTATVEGQFHKVGQQGRHTFYNEVEAVNVTCK